MKNDAHRSFRRWRIEHLDLRHGFTALSADAATGGLFVVFWHGDVPLGQQEFPAWRLPVSAVRLREIALKTITPAVGRHLVERGFNARLPLPPKHDDPTRDRPPEYPALASLDRPLAAVHRRLESRQTAVAGLSASVVVCTRERPAELECCLRALHALRRPPEEILIVDNAPRSDATRRIVEGWPAVRYIVEPRPGLSAARNAGIRAARGDIIAFTDDDVAVAPEWLGRVLEPFSDPQVMSVTGLVLPAQLETEAQFLFQRGDSLFGWGYRELTYDAEYFRDTCGRGSPVWHIGAGANMALCRSFFERVGGYDERLGAGASGCSEDSEMWYRVLAEGGTCVYTPLAVVHHRHRAGMEGLQDQMHQYLRGHVAALMFQFERYGHPGNLWRAFILLPFHYTRLGARTFARALLRRRWPGDRTGSTLRAEVSGYLAGLLFYLKHRRAGHNVAAPSIPERGARNVEERANG